MKDSLQCPSCEKTIKKTRLVVVHPKNNRLLFTCSETCARKMLVAFCTKDQSFDFSTLKIYYNRKSFKDLPIFTRINKKPLNKKRKKKDPISKEEVVDFKINLGLNGDKVIKKLIDSGKRIYNKEFKSNDY